jgi:antitoxin VapB
LIPSGHSYIQNVSTETDVAKSDRKSKLGDNPTFMRVFGSAPWLKVREKKHYRAKVFKSGNSLAVRIPAGTKLAAGMEMDLTIEDGAFLSLEPVDHPKRKFNIAKVAGSARNLRFIRDEDRLFQERPLLWDKAAEIEPKSSGDPGR